MNVLVPRSTFVNVARSVSSKYVKPHPRPFRRRLYEAVAAPIMPKDAPRPCITYAIQKEEWERDNAEYAPIELALADKVKNWINEEQFRVYCICQMLPVKARTFTFARNQLRLKGIESKTYGARIMAKVFEGTPLDVLSPLYVEYMHCLLFAKDISAIRHIVDETKKLPFLFPLAITFDHTILSLDQINNLSQLSDPELLRAQTVQLLQGISTGLTSTLDYQTRGLTHILTQRSQQK